MNTPRIRIGLIGAGAIAQQYAHVFARSEKVRAIGVADVTLEAAKAMGERLCCPAFSSYRKMRESVEGLDAVVICTPPNTHEAISVEFLNSGVHVLCEKPLALNVASASRMLAAAKASETLLTMASKFRYVTDVIRAREIVNSGILGEVVLFENAFTSRVPMAGRWNADPAIGGGGVLIDNGTHSVDVMRYFLGPLSSVKAMEGKRVQGLPVEDTALIMAMSRGGVMGHIDLSWSIQKENPAFISIHGSKGTLMVGWKQSRYREFSQSEWVVFGKGYDKAQAFQDQVENFAASILGIEPPRIGAEDAMASVSVIEAAYRSLDDTRWMEVETLAPGLFPSVSVLNDVRMVR